MNFLMASANAQDAAAAGPAAGMTSLVPLVLMFGIFYFLLIRPQQKRLKEEQALLNTLNKGDEVYTKSGLLGTISGMTDKVITLEVAEGVKLKVLRAQVGGLAKKIFEAATPKKDKKEK